MKSWSNKLTMTIRTILLYSFTLVNLSVAFTPAHFPSKWNRCKSVTSSSPKRCDALGPDEAGLASKRGHAADSGASLPTLSRRSALVLAGAAIGLGASQAAQAFGANAATATSPAPISIFSAETWLKEEFTGKSSQRAGSLSIQGAKKVELLLDEVLEKLDRMDREGATEGQTLDELIEQLGAGTQSEVVQAQLKLLLEDREKSKRARALKKQLSERAKVLERLEAQPAWLVYGSAMFASFGSTLVMHPVDTLKTLKMSNRGGESEASASEPAAVASVKVHSNKRGGNRGAAAAAAAVELSDNASAKIPGPGTLYKGLPAALLKEGPPSALYLGIYETIKTALLPNGGIFPAAATTAAVAKPVIATGAAATVASAAAATVAATAASSSPSNTGILPIELAPLVVYLLAGAAGEVVGTAVRAPSETAKLKVQSGMANTSGEAFGQLARDPKDLFVTWQTIILRDVPFGAIQIALFECTKTAILQSPDIDYDVNTLTAEALLGGFGGAMGSFLTTPADVLVTRLVTQPEPSAGEQAASGEVFVRKTPLEMAQIIFQEGGVGAFFTGAGGRVSYWAPAIAIFLSLYCRLRSLGLHVFP